MKAGKHNPTRKAFWSQHVEGWRSSGLLQRDYCANQGIGLRSFVRWKGILEKPAAKRHAPTACRRAKSAERLIPLAILPDLADESLQHRTQSQDSGIRLQVGSYQINVSINFHADTLKTLLAALGAK